MKISKKTNYSDLKVIALLFAGQNACISIVDALEQVYYDEQPTTTQNGTSILFYFSSNNSINIDEYEYVVDFSKTLTAKNHQQQNFKTVVAPNGTLRYLIKDNSTNFLAFYHNTNRKSTLIKLGLKTIFKLHLSSLLFPSFQVLSKAPYVFLNDIDPEHYHSYAVFTGTPGFWRKPVVQFYKNNKVVSYAKVAINKQTETLIETEKKHLVTVEKLNLKTCTSPNVIHTPNLLLLTNIFLKGQKNTARFTNQHFNTVQELQQKTTHQEGIKESLFYKNLTARIAQLHPQKDFKNIVEKLPKILANLNLNIVLDWHIAHGDFTGWNTSILNNQLYCYDWEMKMENAPLYYDIFHFYHQAATFINKNNSNVFLEVQQLLLQKGTTTNSLSLKIAYQLYLLDVISKNIALTNQQESVSVDQEKMITQWFQSLLKISTPKNATNMRTPFIIELQVKLNTINYAVLKHTNHSLASLPNNSDIDLAILKTDIPAILTFVNTHPSVAYSVSKKKTFMHTLEIHFIDNSFLSVDMIFDFVRKGHRYLNLYSILKNSTYNNGVKVPSIIDDLEYIQQFYTLNKADVPYKYQLLYSNRLRELHLDNYYLSYFNNKYNANFTNLLDSFKYSNDKRKKLKKVKTSIGESFVLKLKYIKDIYTDLTKNKGFIVTFSGVDGAGKTTIINDVKENLETTYRKKVVLLRHRPGVLPIISALKHGGSAKKAEEAAGNRLPRQGKNKSTLSSVVRFSYYYVDYLLGQFYIYCKYVLRGKIVIYDRYYYDFINDSKRSNIQLNRNIIKSLFYFILKPKYNFYLFNTPEVILKRKKELSAKDITTLNKNYQSLFNEFKTQKKAIYTQIKNDDRTQTVATIFKNIYKIPA
ncbi:nucleoside/nucleotide kinase family protein [Wenyingzhuangia aestuarii]|uniref:hypothetical protein n=1 Tax=Wenyingzhuangia aestuarii TaxID=1647582 RepID=UPI00143A615C|nr:hypothetical protein [Wenyingzhuangia aestuarii]NJB82463.1 thymidylate kinase [Wenyingzhuangia aestuarii]